VHESRLYKCVHARFPGVKIGNNTSLWQKESLMTKKLLIFVCLLTLLALGAAVSAHEGREVGNYVIEFGWRVEPAYAGVYNGPEITIENHDTGEPLTGAEATLNLMVHFGDQQKILALYPVFNEPGHYTADLIPTRPGDYGFHLFGKIGDLDVDEEFTSADGEYSSVEPSSDIMFPALDDAASSEAGSTSDLQAQVDALRAELEELKAAQSS
jgi:hypothetical protein